MLEITTVEKTKSVENQLEQAKNESSVTIKNEKPYESSIQVRPIGKQADKPYMSRSFIVNEATKDTIFKLIGATTDYINSIDRNKYNIGQITPNEDNPYRYDLNYSNKQKN